MSKSIPKLTEQLRKAIDECGMSRYELCKKIGMDQGTMSRFMAGKTLSMRNMDLIGEALRLSIVAEKGKANQ
jgi:DNA transposition AAA+ family ATPase